MRGAEDSGYSIRNPRIDWAGKNKLIFREVTAFTIRAYGTDDTHMIQSVPHECVIVSV